MSKTLFTVIALTLAAAPLGVGCNSILGNEHGELYPVEAGMTGFDATTDVDVADTNAPPPDAGPPDANDAEAGPAGCGPGKKTCFGQCVSTLDPLYGCDAVSCAACALGRASATCAGGACAVGTCDPGYFDCNKTPGDGCETDLSAAAHCGTCNAVCDGTPTPYCSPNGSGFACSTNCTALSPTLCGTQCVDLNSSQAHCGDCSTPCPTVANGKETCVARACQLACNPSFHNCSGACVSNADPATCGGSCIPCVAPANAIATCGSSGVCGSVCKPGFHDCGGVCVSNSSVASCGTTSCTACPNQNATSSCNGTSCGFTCATNFGDCDADPTNACETDLLSNGLHCGMCTHSCMGQTCTGGVCDAPLDAGDDADGM